VKTIPKNSRRSWLVVGFIVGYAVASYWPHEPLQASTSDRNDKFAMVTAPLSLGNEGVFVLDFLTGRIWGAALGRSRNASLFLQVYHRNIAEDFKIDANAEPFYAISTGGAAIPNVRGVQYASSALYVAEMNSGKVAAYAIPYQITQQKIPVQPLVPIDFFSFREAIVTE
jgi:hypothetical protein